MTTWRFGCDFEAWGRRMDKDTRRNMAARNDADQGVDAQGGGVQWVDRALQILDTLAREGGAGVSEIAEEMGVHKSTVSRLVGSLLGRELVRQNSDRGKYQLGFGILRLPSSMPGRLSVVWEASDILGSLAARYKETVNLAALGSNYAVNVDQAMGPSRPQPTTGLDCPYSAKMGYRRP
jgi:DNA-binding transcriptional ArsR family regulator